MKKTVTLFLLAAVSLAAANQTQQNNDFTDLPSVSITPSVSPVVAGGANVDVSIDFIYWRSVIRGLEYAFSGISDGGLFVPTGTSVGKGHIQAPKFSFEPGLKIALDWMPGYDGWDVNLQYTWLNELNTKNSLSGHEGVGAGSAIATVFSNGDWYDVDIYYSNATWKQSFNVLDAELGRDFFISRTLTLRPHVGMKFGWIDAQLNLDVATYTEFDEIIDPIIKISLKQNMWGLGIRTGLDSLWHFTKNWGLYSDLAFAGVWSYFNTSGKQNQVYTSTITTLNTGESLQSIVPVIEFSLGFSYQLWFKQNRYQYFLRAGWEEQVWLDFNYIPSVDYSLPGSLSIQGLTIKTGLNF